MSAKFNKQPMSQRLYNSRNAGGPLPRHLMFLINILCKRKGREFPKDLDVKNNRMLADYLKHNFSDQEIDMAHDMARQIYSGANRDKVIFHDTENKSGAPEIDRDDSDKATSHETMSTEQLYNELFPESKREESSREQSKDQKDQSNRESPDSNQNNDEKYVLRSEFVEHIKQEAETFVDIEERIDAAAKQGAASRDILSKDIIALRGKVDEIATQKPLRLEIKLPKLDVRDIGIVHKSFPDLVTAANARLEDGTRLNVWMYGPAGTGKTAAAKKLGNVLFGNDKYYESNAKAREELKAQYNRDWSTYQYSPTLSTGFEVMGYNDANGRYVPTPFYLAYKYGGTFLLDEIDGSMQDALLKLNGALSSSYASFPCGMVERHPDCIILAAANTTGHGGDIEYLGTMKQNIAFLDRWSFLAWPHDDALEDAIILNKSWLARVRQVRRKLNDKKIKGYVITMRASLQGEALLAAGMPWNKVEEMVLRKGLPEGTWRLIKDGR